jgi:hypothetical protein
LAELARRRTDPASAQALARLEEVLDGARRAAQRPVLGPARERAFVERVLASTTREDPSWRGDMRLVSRFVLSRFRESRVVRFVAASLVVHLLVGPMVAVILLRDPPPPEDMLYITLARTDAAPGEPGAEAELGAEGDAATRAAADVRNRLRRARYLLQPAHGAVPAPVGPPAGPEAGAEIRLLDRRSRFLHGEDWGGWLDEQAWERADGVPLALYVELLLDRFARDGERAERFYAALQRLSALDDAAQLGAGAQLGRDALDRAASYGLLERAPARERVDPVDDAWRAALAEALGEPVDPRAAGWLERAP